MEVYAAMIDRMDQGIGRIVAELEAAGPARQHPHFLPAGQRRLRRADGPLGVTITRRGLKRPQAHRPGRAPDRSGRPCRPATAVPCATGRRHARAGGHLRRLWPRLGQRPQHAVPRIQALGPRRRHLHAADRALARRYQAPRRALPPARPSDRHHGDVRGCLRVQYPVQRDGQGRSAKWKATSLARRLWASARRAGGSFGSTRESRRPPGQMEARLEAPRPGSCMT